MSALSMPLQGFPTRFPYGVPSNPVVAKGAADALPVADEVVMVTASAVDAMTLPLPVAGVYPANLSLGDLLGDPKDDGKSILLIVTTAFAHTITTPTGGINKTLHIVTFTAVVGNWIYLFAFGGTWYVIGSQGATLS